MFIAVHVVLEQGPEFVVVMQPRGADWLKRAREGLSDRGVVTFHQAAVS